MSFLLPIEAPPPAETGVPLGPHLHFKGAGDKTQNFPLRNKETLGHHTDTNKTATLNVSTLIPNINTEGLRAETAELILIETTEGAPTPYSVSSPKSTQMPSASSKADHPLKTPRKAKPSQTTPYPQASRPPRPPHPTPPTNEYLHFYNGGTITFLNSNKETIYAQFRNIHTKEEVQSVENAQLRTAADTLATHLGQAATAINSTLAVIKDLTSSIVNNTIVNALSLVSPTGMAIVSR